MIYLHYMTFVLILFFISLISIALILYKRITLIRETEVVITDHSPLLPDAKEVHYILIKNIKEFGFFIVAISIRTYVRSAIIVKKKTSEIYHQIKNKFSNYTQQALPTEKKEVSAFLKTVSDYKKKIKKLKNQIIEEEMNS